MFRLALLIWVVLGTTLAGVGVTIVVSNPDLYNQGMKLIPIAAIGLDCRGRPGLCASSVSLPRRTGLCKRPPSPGTFAGAARGRVKTS